MKKLLNRTSWVMAVMCLVVLLLAEPVIAQTDTATNSEPLEINADQTLEWHRNAKKLIARGNATAIQGDVKIAAETLTADYRDGQQSGFDIYRLTATGNVKLTNPGNSVEGAQAEYNLDTGLAVMTGGNLKMISPQQTVTAQERFTYDVNEGAVTAEGNAVVVRGEDTMRADKITAYFIKNAQNDNELKRIEATGNLVIKTPTETLYGDRGSYNAATQKAEVFSNVRIERGPNILNGTRADVDLSTNISTIYGNQDEGGQVRGIFYPNSN